LLTEVFALAQVHLAGPMQAHYRIDALLPAKSQIAVGAVSAVGQHNFTGLQKRQ